MFRDSVPFAPGSADCQPQWVSTGGGGAALDGTVRAMIVFAGGPDGVNSLYVGGAFTHADGLQVNHIASWDGANWSALGSGLNGSVSALTVFDDGTTSGPALYAGGSFTEAGGKPASRVARWTGDSWSALGTGINDQVSALVVFDDGSGTGPALYAGGDFTTAGGVSALDVAKWDGSDWSAVGGGLNGGGVSSLVVLQDASGGGSLYAGTENQIARWDGQTWRHLGSASVNVLAIFDDGSGSGPALYAGGWFTLISGTAANYVAKWNGEAWTALGQGTDGSVHALAVFDDGLGPALYVGGGFTTAGGVVAHRIAKWDGRAWSELSSEMDGYVTELGAFEVSLDEPAALYVGGSFTTSFAGDTYFAEYRGCAWPCIADIAPPGGDNDVSALDVQSVIDAFGQPCDSCADDIAPPGGDGQVTISDVIAVISAFGACQP